MTMRLTSRGETVDCIIGGEGWMDTISEFLGELYSDPLELQRMIWEESGLTGGASQDACAGPWGGIPLGAGVWTSPGMGGHHHRRSPQKVLHISRQGWGLRVRRRNVYPYTSLGSLAQTGAMDRSAGNRLAIGVECYP